MKILKKTILILFIAMMSAAMVACTSSKSPSKEVSKILDSIKDGSNTEFCDEVMERSAQDLAEPIAEQLKKVEYKINSEKIDGDSATVNISIKSVAMCNVYSEVLTKINEEVNPNSSSKMKYDKKVQSLFYPRILSGIGEVEFTERQVDIELVKENDEWTLKNKEYFYTLLMNYDNEKIEKITNDFIEIGQV